MFEEFSGWFSGKTSPVHLFWHSLDLAVTRFSGRPAPPIDADAVTQEAYSQELISFGFWAGDDNVADAAYYSYTSPEPDGLRDQAAARRATGSSSATDRSPSSPTRQSAPHPTRAATLLAFLQAAYEAGARLAGWDTEQLRVELVSHPEPAPRASGDRGTDFGRPGFGSAPKSA